MNTEQLIQLLQTVNPSEQQSGIAKDMIGKVVLVRTYSAGVHYGKLTERAGDECVLEDARRIWSWSGAFTLSTIATKGVRSAKMPNKVEAILLTGVIEVIPMTSYAIKVLDETESHDNS